MEPRELRKRARALMAEANAIEDGTLPWLRARQNSVTPTDLASALSLSVQAANNRLRALYDVGILTRERVAREGKQYRYSLRAAADRADPK